MVPLRLLGLEQQLSLKLQLVAVIMVRVLRLNLVVRTAIKPKSQRRQNSVAHRSRHLSEPAQMVLRLLLHCLFTLIKTPEHLLLLPRRHGRRQLLRLVNLLMLLLLLGISNHQLTGSSRSRNAHHRRHAVRRTGRGRSVSLELLSHVSRRLENGEHSLWAYVSCELLFGIEKVRLDLLQPLLEEGDESDAAIDRVPEAGLRLVGQGVDGVIALRSAELVEDLGDIAGAEDLVDVGKPLGVVRWEVRREDALRRALPP